MTTRAIPAEAPVLIPLDCAASVDDDVTCALAVDAPTNADALVDEAAAEEDAAAEEVEAADEEADDDDAEEVAELDTLLVVRDELDAVDFADVEEDVADVDVDEVVDFASFPADVALRVTKPAVGPENVADAVT